MRNEARAVLKVLARNQGHSRTWKAYMTIPQVFHAHLCSVTRCSKNRCDCGATELRKEFASAWKKFTTAVRRNP